MRSDLLSKRVFQAGCFGLPWLWTVHALYHWKNASAFSENVVDDEALLNPDDRKCTGRLFDLIVICCIAQGQSM